MSNYESPKLPGVIFVCDDKGHEAEDFIRSVHSLIQAASNVDRWLLDCCPKEDFEALHEALIPFKEEKTNHDD